MAFKHVSAVIESWLPAAEKLVALAIAESASREDDQCWLSLERIAQRASCSVRGAQKVILRLEQMGVTARVGKKPVNRGYVWIFQIYIEKLPADMPDECRGEPRSPVGECASADRATVGGKHQEPATGEPRSPLTPEQGSPVISGPTGERNDRWGEPGSGVRVNGGPLRGERGSDNPILTNQVSEPVSARPGPGSRPARPDTSPDERELRVANSSARNLGIDPMRPGETLAQLDARIGVAQLARVEAIKRQHQATAA
jgi:hypothetical protein